MALISMSDEAVACQSAMGLHPSSCARPSSPSDSCHTLVEETVPHYPWRALLMDD